MAPARTQGLRIGFAVVLLLTVGTQADAQERAGVVTTLQGTVTVMRASLTEPAPLRFRDDIFVRDRIATGDDSLARVLLASQDLAALTRRLAALSAAHLPGASLAGSAQIPPEIAAHHLVVASIGLIQWWLDHHRPYPAERMGEVFAALVIAPVEALQTAARA